MGPKPTTYQLLRGETLLGTITHDPADDRAPWHNGHFKPAPAFKAFRPLFTQELRLLDDARMNEWETLRWEIIGPGLKLQPETEGEGRLFPRFLIHIKGKKAWWREWLR